MSSLSQAVSMGTADDPFVGVVCLSFRFIINKRVTAQISTEGEPAYTYFKEVT